MNRQFAGVYPSTVFEGEEDTQIDIEMESPSTYFQAQHPQHIPHDQPGYVEQNSSGIRFPIPEHYQNMSCEYQMQRSHQRHHSTSTQSTHSSFVRSSNGSGFSQFHYPRSSVASTNTAYSQSSDFSTDHLAQTERSLDSHSPITSPPPPPPFEEPAGSPPAKRGSQRQPPQEKEPFQDCRSRKKRSRRSQKEPRYWCTSCKEGFGEKYDWKRHEETYQERTETFACNLCKNIYFLDKDFVYHHQKSHRCQVCAEYQHVDLARRKRMARTGWGCGFCNHFSSDWTERCNHISWHFEKSGHTMAEWHHSQVIWSLLQRPEILREFHRLFEIKRRTRGDFSWKSQTTGRVEGYPEANPQPQLQDLLEFYTPDQSAAEVVQLAFEKGLREKELPPPPVPEKDHRPTRTTQDVTHDSTQHFATRSASLQDAMSDILWNNILSTIPEDENQAANVCMLDPHDLQASFNYAPQHFHSFQ